MAQYSEIGREAHLFGQKKETPCFGWRQQQGISKDLIALSLAQTCKKFNIENINQSKRGKRAEFADKNAILRRSYREIAAFDFYDFLFSGDLSEKTYVTEGKTYASARVEDILEMSSFRADVYIPPVSFFNGAYRTCCMKQIFALVLDIDNLNPAQLHRLIDTIRTKPELPTPTLIINSGSGVHLYFCFEKPIDAYKRRLPTLRAMLAKLAVIYTGHGKMDRHPLIQSFRPPGAQTKLGDIATAYTTGPRWTVPFLAAILGVDAAQWEGDTVTTNDKKPALPPKPRKPKVAVLPRVAAGERLFWYCGDRTYKLTDLGNRYLALFALAIVGYKCRVPQEKVIYEMESLIDCWNSVHPDNPVAYSEIKKAMKGYSQDYVMVTAATLEEYFGWSFERKIPRKGRTREQHLRRALAIRHAGEKEDIKYKLERYVAENPGASLRQIERETGLNFRTIKKYYPQK